MSFSPSAEQDPDIIPNITWFGQKVRLHKGTLDSLRQHIPDFERVNFQLDGGENLYLDLILRKPLFSDEGKRIPVGTVSKAYVLIQHHDVLDALRDGLKAIGFQTEGMNAELRLSEYGERMHLSLNITNDLFDPGDGYPLTIKLNCINSVDKSSALEINLSWFRLVCSNGLFETDSPKMRKVHLGQISASDVAEFLKERLSDLQESRAALIDWLEAEITIDGIEQWADNVLSKSWGSHLAARACHIARTGYDGDVTDPFIKMKPHELAITSKVAVPGACAPITNVFHLSQALSWLARNRNTIQDQFSKMTQIPTLVHHLLN